MDNNALYKVSGRQGFPLFNVDNRLITCIMHDFSQVLSIFHSKSCAIIYFYSVKNHYFFDTDANTAEKRLTISVFWVKIIFAAIG